MTVPLDTITIKGFKSFQSLEKFELKNLNILIGANGAGKSNFIDFFRLLSNMMKPEGLKEFVAGNADMYLFGGPKQTKSIVVQMVFGLNGYDFELAPTEDGFFLINNEQRHYFLNENKKSTRNLGSGSASPHLILDKDDTSVRGNGPGASYYTYNAIKSWNIYHFHDTTKESGMRRYHDVGHYETLEADASNIASFLLHLQEEETDTYKSIIQTIKLVNPFFENFILKPDKNENVRLQWQQKGMKDLPMRPSQLSDGSIRFICLATALLQPNPPSTIIIDEPELGLHPYAIEILGELILTASQRTQLIVSTQSTVLVDYFDPENIVVVNRKDGASEFQRLNSDSLSSWLNDYSLGELWRKNILLGGPSHEE